MEKILTILSEAAQNPKCGLTQFTIDYAEAEHTVTALQLDEGSVSNQDMASSIIYGAENVLAIMKPELPDVLFFERLKKACEEVTAG